MDFTASVSTSPLQRPEQIINNLSTESDQCVDAHCQNVINSINKLTSKLSERSACYSSQLANIPAEERDLQIALENATTSLKQISDLIKSAQFKFDNRNHDLYTILEKGLLRQAIFSRIPTSALLTCQRVSRKFQAFVQRYLSEAKALHPTDCKALRTFCLRGDKHSASKFLKDHDSDDSRLCGTFQREWQLFKKMKSLSNFSLTLCGSTYCSIGDFGLETLKHLSTQLVSLKVYLLDNPLIVNKIFNSLEKGTLSLDLSISTNRNSYIQTKTLETVSKLMGLRSLNIEQISSDSIPLLSTLYQLESFSCNRFNGGLGKWAPFLEACPNLKSFKTSYMTSKDSSLDLNILPLHTQIERLSLHPDSRNKVVLYNFTNKSSDFLGISFEKLKIFKFGKMHCDDFITNMSFNFLIQLLTADQFNSICFKKIAFSDMITRVPPQVPTQIQNLTSLTFLGCYISKSIDKIKKSRTNTFWNSLSNFFIFPNLVHLTLSPNNLIGDQSKDFFRLAPNIKSIKIKYVNFDPLSFTEKNIYFEYTEWNKMITAFTNLENIDFSHAVLKEFPCRSYKIPKGIKTIRLRCSEDVERLDFVEDFSSNHKNLFQRPPASILITYVYD